MKLTELEVYSEASNVAVIRPPGRRFPGSVIQGDSLANLCAEAKEISEWVRDLKATDKELLGLVQQHQENLLGRLLHYQTVLQAHGISLPYRRPVSASDLVVLIPADENEDEAEDKHPTNNG